MESTDTSVRIPGLLREVLDKIVERDPQYPDRSALVKAWLWEKIKSIGYFDESKFGKEKDAALVEATKTETALAEG